MKSLMNWNIATKQIVACLAFGLIPLAIVGVMTWTTANKIIDTTANQYNTIAAGVADKIDRNLFERYGDVQAFGLNRVILDKDAWYQPGESNPVVSAMNHYVDTYDIYYLTLLVDLDGNLIAVNDRDQDSAPINTSELYEENFASESWFQDAKAGRFYESKDGSFTGTVVEHLYVDPHVENIYTDEGLALGFTAPVFDPEGNVIAVWKNVAKFSLVEEIIWATYVDLQQKRIRLG